MPGLLLAFYQATSVRTDLLIGVTPWLWICGVRPPMCAPTKASWRTFRPPPACGARQRILERGHRRPEPSPTAHAHRVLLAGAAADPPGGSSALPDRYRLGLRSR